MVLIQFVAGIGYFQAWNSPKSAKHGYAKFASRRQGSPPHLQTVSPAPGAESRNFEVANTLNCRAPGSSRVSCEHCISFSGDFIEDTTACYWPGMSRPSYQAIIAHFRLFQRIRVWYTTVCQSLIVFGGLPLIFWRVPGLQNGTRFGCLPGPRIGAWDQRGFSAVESVSNHLRMELMARTRFSPIWNSWGQNSELLPKTEDSRNIAEFINRHFTRV